MRLTRRQVLAGGAAGVLLPGGAWAADMELLTARVADVQLLPAGYGTTSIWSYGDGLVGPEIRVTQGDRVQRRLVNDLPTSTTVHWHGIRIDNAMDGVVGLTQEAVQPGGTFDYDFVARDAGTFWYHSHDRSFEQVGRGLYGPLIVEEPEGPDIDAEHVLVLDDWLVDPETEQLVGDWGSFMERSHAGRIGNYVTTNGDFDLVLSAPRHARLRLRLINAATAKVFQLALEGMEGWIVARDGMPLEAPEPLEELLLMAPAQRVDLLVDVTAEVGETAHLVQLDRGEAFSQAAFTVTEGDRARREAPGPLPPNDMPEIDLTAARSLPLRMEGGAMRGLMDATLDGEAQDMRAIAQRGFFWAFNGAVAKMDGPAFAELSLGETLRVALTNDTAFPHGMHLHGMHFREVLAGGALGPWLDTILVLPEETREIAFVADNPGDWLFHCHMLAHAVSGMTTWLRVG